MDRKRNLNIKYKILLKLFIINVIKILKLEFYLKTSMKI